MNLDNQESYASPDHYRVRILDALKLQPMSAKQLAMCLGCTHQNIRDHLATLVKRNRVRPHGWIASPSENRRKSALWVNV